MYDTELTLPYDYLPRGYQRPVWDYFEKGGKRGLCIWHRRAGKDLFALNMLITKMVQRRGLYWHVFPTYNQGRKIVWDGFTKDGRAFLEYFPQELIHNKNNTEMKIEIKTGSIYQVVGSDNVDRLVGTNPIGCIFSEYSLQDRRAWDMIRPILAENGGWALFVYTPRGKNHGHDLLEQAKKPGSEWFWEILTVENTQAIPMSVVEEDRKSGMPEELVLQEYFCSFDAPLVGAYYSTHMRNALAEGRIGNFGWEPRLPVDTAWDLGIDDATSIVCVQNIGNEVRFIDYYENSGEGLAHYVKHLQSKDYTYRKHFGPHDIEVRELGTGKSRLEVAKSLGLRFQVVPKHEIEDGIEAVRGLLPRVYFNDQRCERLIEALRQYRKEWDDERRCFKNQPLHDWTSNPADATRYYAWGAKDKRFNKEKFPDRADNKFNLFGR